MLNIIGWILFGALAGWLASIIMKTNQQQGALANIVIGILGAIIGGFIFSMLGGDNVDDFSLYSLIVAVIGSVILIALLKAFRGPKASS
jgi:uncharacterized membrane protein YeaQ/YmgE (transglycosylase-associated protein family)